MSRFPLWLAAGISLLIPAAVFSAGEHQQRFAVELALIVGDNRLLNGETLSAEKRRWIEGRITSSLNVLPLLARHFLQEVGSDDAILLKQVRSLQQYATGSSQLYEAASELSRRFPIQFVVDIEQPLGPHNRAQTLLAYQQMCLGCHTAPAKDSSVVVGNFGSFARAVPDDEWLARLLGGLRGDSYTAYENPFSDAEIAAFYRYIRDELP